MTMQFRPRTLSPHADTRALTDAVNQIIKGFGGSSTSYGPFTDGSTNSDIWRFSDRVFVGAGVLADGTTTGGKTFVGLNTSDSVMGAQYIERAATTFSPSGYGGVGVAGASRSSDQYAAYGATVWVTGVSVAAGAKRGYAGKVYTTPAGGTTGITPPTHSAGSVSDGGVTWAFSTYTYLTPIGGAFLVMGDVDDSRGAHAIYIEAQRTATGGTVFGGEVAGPKNRGGDVVTDPYASLAAGSTHGLLFAGGADDTYGGAAANNTSVAQSFIKNAKPYNSVRVVASDAVALDGAGRGYVDKLAAGHMLAWYGAAGQLGARIWSSNTTNSTDCGIEFLANTIRFIGSGGTIVGTVENVASAAAYIRLISATSGNNPEVRAGGSATDIDLVLTPKGSGLVKYGTKSAKGAEAFSDFFTQKMADGTTVKVMICS